MSARPEIVITNALSSTDDLAGAGAGAPGAGATPGASLPTSTAAKPTLSITPPVSPDAPHGSHAAPTHLHTAPTSQGHARRPSDPTLLSPILKPPGGSGSARPSLDLSSDDGHSSDNGYPPASPTTSVRSSVRFSQGLTSTDLRHNRVDADSGATSLALLGPPSASEGGHRRKLSNATFTSERTVADPNVATPPMSTPGKDIPLAPLASRTSDVATVREPGTPLPKKKGSLDNKGMAEDQDGEDKEARPALDLHEDEGLDLGLFQFGPVRLASLVDPKSMDSLRDMGGIDGLIAGLGTHASNGLEPTAATPPSGTTTEPPPVSNVESRDKAPNKAVPAEGNVAPGPAHGASYDDRTRVYGTNVLPTRKSKSLLQLMWLALKDKVLVILSFAAVISFALGLFQDFGTPREPGEPPVDWVEGVAIMVAILIVVLVGSVNDWQKERQFKALGEKRDERGIKVVRGGVEMVVDVRQVLVGDVALLEPGEVIPCDGVFLAGHNVRCDESGATGESDAIKKVGFSEAERLAKQGDDEHAHTDCFIISGSKVLEGYGRYVVIAVGPKSFNGRIMMAMRGGSEDTPLQLKLNGLAELIAKMGTAAGLLLFSALMIRFFVQLGTGEPQRTAAQKGMAFVNILIIAVTIVVVAVPEGLPLAVTLALAFATKRMTKENLLVRVLGSCETMANASVVATDKTGTLTLNEMTIVAGSVGVHAKFVRRLEEHAARTNANDSARRHAQDFSLDQSQLNTVLGPSLRTLFNEAICVNSTAFEDEDKNTGVKAFVGSKTETALLSFAQELEWANWKKTRQSKDILQMVPFSSERKAMGVIVRHGAGARIYLKGASEILTGKCTMHVVVREGGGDDEGDVQTTEITELEAENISRTIIFYANQTLRTIALCYRDFESWPPKDARFLDNERTEVDYNYMARDMTLIGIVGIEDPLRPSVREAVANCHRAGVAVKMCTGDNVLTARSIALQCGIYTAGGIVMEGPVFRTLDDAAMLEVVPRLQVLARSSPEDKQILVNKLKELGEIVGVTGDGTNDGPALKSAHVGFSMGIAGTEVAKEASDIILMDDNFASIVKAIMWGRAVNDAVRKFLQFQIAVNITAVIITFVSAVASAEEESVLSAVQLLWVNIIMDTFAALALATDPATESSLDRKPERASAPLFDVNMYKQIFGQAAYQTAVALIFHFLGYQILGYGEHNKENDLMVQTLVFNQFVFAQIFNSFNARRLDNKLNVFEGMLKNYYFMGITALEFAIQVLIVFVGGAAFHVTSITGKEWGISIALGFVSIPLGALIRCIPNGPCERLFIALHVLPNPASLLPTTKEPKESAAAGQNWNYAIDRVTDNLGTFANVRGGRMRGSSFVDRSRSAPGGGSDARPQMSALMAMVPTLVASTVGARWAPAPSEGLSDPGNHDPSRSTAQLWVDKIEVHPDTKEDDFAYKRWGRPKNDV